MPDECLRCGLIRKKGQINPKCKDGYNHHRWIFYPSWSEHWYYKEDEKRGLMQNRDI